MLNSVKAQVVMENKYSKHNKRGIVIKDLLLQLGLYDKAEQGIRLVNNYRSKSYWESKDKRIAELTLESDEIVLELLIIISLLDNPTTIQNIMGQLASKLEYEDQFDGAKTAGELLGVVCFTDLYDIYKDGKYNSLHIKSNIKLSTEAQQIINNYKYLPPMLCKPIEITHNNMGPHITIKSDSILLKSYNKHNLPQALDTINISNSIAMSLDTDMLEFEEKPKKKLDTTKKVIQFTMMRHSSRKVYNEILEAGNKFYLSNKVDSRGRKYMLGYHINLQSTQYKKSLINLYKKEVITV